MLGNISANMLMNNMKLRYFSLFHLFIHCHLCCSSFVVHFHERPCWDSLSYFLLLLFVFVSFSFFMYFFVCFSSFFALSSLSSENGFIHRGSRWEMKLLLSNKSWSHCLLDDKSLEFILQFKNRIKFVWLRN